MDSKVFWQSKTFWTNIVTAGGLIINSQMQGYDLGPEAQAIIVAFVNVVLRFITKNKVTLK